MNNEELIFNFSINIEKKTDPPFDPSPYKKLDSEFIGKLLREKISKGECAGKGYVLDNYPKTYQDCLYVFANEHKKRILKEKEKEEDEDEYIEIKEMTKKIFF